MTACRLVSRVLLVAVLACALRLLTSGGSASADPSGAQWLALRGCESSDNYSVVSANGRYYGAYQFNLSTWQSVGGFGLPTQASHATIQRTSVHHPKVRSTARRGHAHRTRPRSWRSVQAPNSGSSPLPPWAPHGCAQR